MSQFPNSSQNPDPYQNSDSQDLNLFAQWNTFSQHVVDQVINDDSEERLLRMQIESQTQDEEANNSNRQRRRSATRAYKEREREDAHDRIYKDYFGTHPTFSPETFRRRYRMRQSLFFRIVESLGNHSEYFQLRVDATGRPGLSPIQKCMASLRLLAYGAPADSVDEYFRVAESTAIECLSNFCRGINEVFGAQYLRRPNADDIARLLKIGEDRGFPGMLGSLDCMHWEWKNCPVAWKGMFTRGDHKRPTIMLEAVASADLWIWHAYFGAPGTNNDINVLNESPLFANVLQGHSPDVEFMVNGTSYNMGYYLTDGIYPEWATLVKPIPMPQGPKRQLFAKCPSAVRKDVERAFGVLQSRFAIVSGPARPWHGHVLKDIMLACIIMHNMIVEDERDGYAGNFPPAPLYEQPEGYAPPPLVSGPIAEFTNMFIQMGAAMRDRQIHRQLQADLIEHVWGKFGSYYNPN